MSRQEKDIYAIENTSTWFEGRSVSSYMAKPGTFWRVTWTFASLRAMHQFAAAKELSISVQVADLDDLFGVLKINKLPTALQARVKPKVVSHIRYWMKEWMELPQLRLSRATYVARWPSYTKAWAAHDWDGDWTPPLEPTKPKSKPKPATVPKVADALDEDSESDSVSDAFYTAIREQLASVEAKNLPVSELIRNATALRQDADKAKRTFAYAQKAVDDVEVPGSKLLAKVEMTLQKWLDLNSDALVGEAVAAIIAVKRSGSQ